MTSFDNTRIAFAGKSNTDLDRAEMLFRMLDSNTLVSFGELFTPIAFKLGLPVKGIIRKTIFRQFVGGESIADSQGVIHDLNSRGVGTILDFSVEGQNSENAFRATYNELMRTVEEAGVNPSVPFSVFKVTGIASNELLHKVSEGITLESAEREAWSKVCERVDQLCRRAAEVKTRILIDAEESWYQKAVDDLAAEMMKKYNRESPVVFNTLQMYRHDRLAFLQQSLETAFRENYNPGYKIVRGAYMEKERERAEELNYPSPIQPDKASTDRDYNAALDICMNHIERIGLCAGTHNEESCYALMEMMDKRNINPGHQHVWFAQLLGMSDHISFNLAAAGYNVAKYVPYGPVEDVLPYLIRRARENTSVAGQTGRELKLIRIEKERRRTSAK